MLFPTSSTVSRDALPLPSSRPRTVIKQAVAHSSGVRFCLREGAATGAEGDSQADLLPVGKWRFLVQESWMRYSHLSNQNASIVDFPRHLLSCSKAVLPAPFPLRKVRVRRG